VNNIRHWSELSRNPISEEAMQFVKSALEASYCGPVFDLDMFWVSQLKGKTLLDIGVVEHTMELTQRAGWRHKIFKGLASKTVGVDILPEAVAELNEQGYDIRLCDATSDTDLLERFEIVYIGDVVEHVNDPIRLLKFAVRHLADGGKIIVSTPCPFWWRNIQLMTKDSTYLGNVDHVRWLVPVNALEMAHRAGAELQSYYTIETEANSLIKKLVHGLVRATFGRTELFTWAYAYVFGARP